MSKIDVAEQFCTEENNENQNSGKRSKKVKKGKPAFPETAGMKLNRNIVAFRPRCKTCGFKIRGANHNDGSHHATHRNKLN